MKRVFRWKFEAFRQLEWPNIATFWKSRICWLEFMIKNSIYSIFPLWKLKKCRAGIKISNRVKLVQFYKFWDYVNFDYWNLWKLHFSTFFQRTNEEIRSENWIFKFCIYTILFLSTFVNENKVLQFSFNFWDSQKLNFGMLFLLYIRIDKLVTKIQISLCSLFISKNVYRGKIKCSDLSRSD